MGKSKLPDPTDRQLSDGMRFVYFSCLFYEKKTHFYKHILDFLKDKNPSGARIIVPQFRRKKEPWDEKRNRSIVDSVNIKKDRIYITLAELEPKPECTNDSEKKKYIKFLEALLKRTDDRDKWFNTLTCTLRLDSDVVKAVEMHPNFSMLGMTCAQVNQRCMKIGRPTGYENDPIFQVAEATSGGSATRSSMTIATNSARLLTDLSSSSARSLSDYEGMLEELIELNGTTPLCGDQSDLNYSRPVVPKLNLRMSHHQSPESLTNAKVPDTDAEAPTTERTVFDFFSKKLKEHNMPKQADKHIISRLSPQFFANQESLEADIEKVLSDFDQHANAMKGYPRGPVRLPWGVVRS